MRKLRTRLGAVILAVFVLAGLTAPAFTPAALAKTQLKDVSSSWAKSDILSLVGKGVIKGYPNGTFRPQKGVTRAEFAKILATAFHLDPTAPPTFPDAKSSWARSNIAALAERGIINGYPDGTFRPNNPIDRAEMIAMVTRALNFGDKDGIMTQGWPETFSDINNGNWAFKSVEIANRLGLLPPYYTDRLEPNVEATRADTAHMVNVAMGLNRVKGTILSVDKNAMAMTVTTDQKDTVTFTLPYDAIILRNGTIGDINSLTAGDSIQLLAGSDRVPHLVQTAGVITRTDVENKVSLLTNGLLKPAQVEDVIKGNWKGLGSELTSGVYNQLLAMGVTPEEAASILSRNWKNLKSLEQERLGDALSTQLNLPVDVLYALRDRNWSKVLDMAKIQLTQNLLGGLINLNS